MDVSTLIIGAGVVGLAIARRMARSGHDVVVLERDGAFGGGVSARNSEVVHAGLYYPTGSLKARLCIEGRRLLYEHCVRHGVAHRRYGKLVVATEETERQTLEGIARQAEENGVEECAWIDGREAGQLEPDLRCVAALHSRTTGVVSAHELMLSLVGEVEDHGGALALNSPFEGARALAGGGFEVRVGGSEPMRLTSRLLVNAASLDASAVARRIEGLAAQDIPETRYAKGHYFQLTGRTPFSRLIYPVPVPGGLGTHITLDLSGRAKFGPDVAWIEAPDFAFDEDRAASFYTSVRRYWPGLPDGALAPDYVGVRPKISGPGEPPADFRIDGPERHGLDGLVNLFGIESPGLTSSLAIAEHVASLLE